MMDLISRKATINAIREEFDWLDSQRISDLRLSECEERVISILSGMADAQPECKKGRWKWIKEGDDFPRAYGRYVCSNCGYPEPRFDVSKFCPNCGSDMRGE